MIIALIAILVVSWLVQWWVNDTKDAKIKYLEDQNRQLTASNKWLDHLTDIMFDETDMKRAYHAGADSVYVDTHDELRQDISGGEWLAGTYRDPVQENKSIAQQLEEKLWPEDVSREQVEEWKEYYEREIAQSRADVEHWKRVVAENDIKLNEARRGAGYSHGEFEDEHEQILNDNHIADRAASGMDEDYRLNEQYQEANNPYRYNQFNSPEEVHELYSQYPDRREWTPEKINVAIDKYEELIAKVYHERAVEGTIDMEQYTQLERECGHVSTSDAHIEEQERLYWESEKGQEDRRITGQGC